jgi:hypothetical protein
MSNSLLSDFIALYKGIRSLSEEQNLAWTFAKA